ncbi:MAG: EAL domain-containing response regulator [Bradyrhizobium sp.]|nr:EAL domain-containing response regulator [Bradyrhizobium sp.]
MLVVDDDVVQRTVIGMTGAKLGYDTVTVSTFEDASAQLRTNSFDIMTLDLSLGERDGVELLRLLAELKLNAMPVVIISGCDERILNATRRVGQALKLSLTRCLTKPLELDKLREALLLPAHGRSNPAGEAASPAIDRERILAALSRNEFFVEFQPKVELQTGRVVGVEALARWHMPEFGMVSPALFIPLAEQLGLMPDLTCRILSLAVGDIRRVVNKNPGFTVAVNISGSLLNDLLLPERIESALNEHGVAPQALIVEVTESVAMSDVERAMDILLRLRIKGIGASIDDFGTGFSSLAALARLPFSELKIDQSFARNCDRDQDMIKIVQASIGLARAFGMTVVAEGIDNPHALAKLRAAGCDTGQGYLFAPSLKIERVARWMVRWHDDITGHRSAMFLPTGQISPPIAC